MFREAPVLFGRTDLVVGPNENVVSRPCCRGSTVSQSHTRTEDLPRCQLVPATTNSFPYSCARSIDCVRQLQPRSSVAVAPIAVSVQRVGRWDYRLVSRGPVTIAPPVSAVETGFDHVRVVVRSLALGRPPRCIRSPSPDAVRRVAQNTSLRNATHDARSHCRCRERYIKHGVRLSLHSYPCNGSDYRHLTSSIVRRCGTTDLCVLRVQHPPV